MGSGWTRQGQAWNDPQFQPFVTVAQGNPEGGSHPYCTINTLEMPAVKGLKARFAPVKLQAGKTVLKKCSVSPKVALNYLIDG